MKKILALDLGTKTGWAFCNSHGVISSGSKSFLNTRFESVGMRFLKFNDWLNSVNYIDGGFDIVYFESVNRHLGTAAAHAYGGYMGVLMAWCEFAKIPYQGIGVGTIKLSACGNGRASKKDMVNKAIELGFYVGDDNQADAIHLLRYAISRQGNLHG